MQLEENLLVLRGDVMATVKIKCPKKFQKTETFFEKIKEKCWHKSLLDKYGAMGVDALRYATPVDSGKTADSWSYAIETTKTKTTLTWTNSNVNDGVNIAIILQYGHGTRFGAYVQGTDYINPAIQKIFDELADQAWKEVTDV